MQTVDQWTARHACALQAALRMTNEAFAARLGISVRTVASWHARQSLVPKSEFQQVLDTALAQAAPEVATRFGHLLGAADCNDTASPSVTEARSMHIAIAIVRRDEEILLACRRGEDAGGIAWQFPAGIVKPDTSPQSTAIREVLAETDVRCSVRQKLGGRVHPITSVYCEYFLCEYLGGTARNNDAVENMDVTWAPREDVTRYIPRESIYPAVLPILDGEHD